MSTTPSLQEIMRKIGEEATDDQEWFVDTIQKSGNWDNLGEIVDTYRMEVERRENKYAQMHGYDNALHVMLPGPSQDVELYYTIRTDARRDTMKQIAVNYKMEDEM